FPRESLRANKRSSARTQVNVSSSIARAEWGQRGPLLYPVGGRLSNEIQLRRPASPAHAGRGPSGIRTRQSTHEGHALAAGRGRGQGRRRAALLGGEMLNSIKSSCRPGRL